MNLCTLQSIIVNYNNGQYIDRCIESVVMQECSFNHTIHIIDDASVDNSHEIIQKWLAKYPEKIRLTQNTNNCGVLEVAKTMASTVQAQYLCVVDADDYFTNPQKLQAQVSFLENNPGYAGCFHDAEIVSSVPNEANALSNRSQNTYKYYSQFNRYKPDILPGDIVKRTIIPTAALVFRHTSLHEVLQRQTDYLSLFWVMQLEIIKNSRFRYFNECWSVYRDHPAGVSKTHNLIRFKNQHIGVLKQLLLDPYYKYFEADIYESIAEEYKNMIWAPENTMHHAKQRKEIIRQFKRYSKLALKHRIKTFYDIV